MSDRQSQHFLDQSPRVIFEAEALTIAPRPDAQPSLDRLTLRANAGDVLTVLGREHSGVDVVKALFAGFPLAGRMIEGSFRLGVLEGAAEPRTAYWAATDTLAPHASAAGQLARALARRQHIPLGSAREELRIQLSRLGDKPSLERLRARPAQTPPQDLAVALLALALAQQPHAVVAGDPLRALDPREAQAVIEILLQQQAERKFTLVYFTGDAGIPVRIGGRVAVLREGKLVEEGPVTKLATEFVHPYTQSLFAAAPRVDTTAMEKAAPRSEPLIQMKSFAFQKQRRFDPAKGITFDLRRGAGLALVGERGSGRRSLARAILGLAPLRQGRIIFDAVDIGPLSSAMRAQLRRRVVFITGEDDVLDPRMSVRDTVAEPLRTHLNLGAQQNERTTIAALNRVGLGELPRSRRPGELDVLDRRRLQIARAIAATASLAVLYEPLAGLDSLSGSLIVDLLRDYRARSGVAFLLVTANIAVAQMLTEEVLIIKDRAVVERGLIWDVIKNPQNPYTKALIAAVAPMKPRALPPVAPAG
jgi:ABC-type microcin C transport system duplicated ATPase subunit YejF